MFLSLNVFNLIVELRHFLFFQYRFVCRFMKGRCTRDRTFFKCCLNLTSSNTCLRFQYRFIIYFFNIRALVVFRDHVFFVHQISIDQALARLALVLHFCLNRPHRALLKVHGARCADSRCADSTISNSNRAFDPADFIDLLDGY